MRKSILTLAMVLAVSGCGYQHRPIYTVDDPVPLGDQTFSSQKLEALIVAACETLNWKTQHVADGHIMATQSREKFSATVDILFDDAHWQIRYNTSTGLNAEDGKIHDHYNVWVRNLEREIRLHLTAAAPIAGQ